MRRRPTHWTGRSIVATVLAVGVSVSLMAAFVGASIASGPSSDALANLLSTAFGGVVGALAVFLGKSDDATANRRATDPDPEAPPATLEIKPQPTEDDV